MRDAVADAKLKRWRRCVCFVLPVGIILFSPSHATPQSPTTAPQTLQQTGLYVDFASLLIDPGHLAFSPQYPLWSDGAAKRRWISLPAGATIDASDPDAWVFPVGTRFWKEFSFGGNRVETRYMELRASGEWLFAAYAWSEDGRTTELVSERGRRGAYPLAEGRSHAIPGVSDCKACHQGGRTQVLGFSALQLSPDRDQAAPHKETRPPPGVDLLYLAKSGWLTGLPDRLLQKPPRIEASSPVARSLLGYLHGNCGHCHNSEGSLANLDLILRQSLDRTGGLWPSTLVGRPVQKLAPGQSPTALLRIKPGHPERSGIAQRIGSRYPPLQMPPLGTELVDEEAVSLLAKWIVELNEKKTTRTAGGNAK